MDDLSGSDFGAKLAQIDRENGSMVQLANVLLLQSSTHCALLSHL